MTATTFPSSVFPTAHVFQQWQDAVQKAFAMPKVMEAVQRVRVGVTPSRAVYHEDNVRLMQYEASLEKRYKTPLLVVFALVNRPYILDLRAGKSVVSHFVNRGFDVYNLDWGVPTPGDRHLAIRDYVLGYLNNAVEHICKRTGSESVNILGYCMGGSLSAMYAALRPKRVKNFISLAAPYDWSSRDSLLCLWTDEKYFNVDRMIEVHGNAPPIWLQTSFLLLKPVQNLMEKYINFYENMEDEKFLDDFFAMETWLNDNIPVAGETFREFVKYCFQQNLLMQGKLELGGERVNLKNLTAPLLNLVAQHDHLVPPSQSTPLNDAVGSSDRKTIHFPAGHIGMAVGGKAHRDLWPAACAWLEERSEVIKS